MWDRLWDAFVNALIALFLPFIASFHLIYTNIFLNVSSQDAKGLELMGNLFLTPFQYLFVGKQAQYLGDGSYAFVQRFEYTTSFWPRTAVCAFALVPSTAVGSALKALSYFDPHVRSKHLSMRQSLLSKEIKTNRPLYEKLGFLSDEKKEASFLVSQGFQRKAGDELILKEGKDLLGKVGQILSEENILWWIDCGTLLGAYRYGGIIPWDHDIDMAILNIDVENVRRALNRLDPKEYVLQDWSGRDFPNTLFKVYLKKTNQWIDIYTYRIDEKNKEIACIFSLENNIFCPTSWKALEKCFSRPVSFDVVFPLKKGHFDGVEVFVPNQTAQFLKRYYGDDLSPVKIFNPQTGCFEKDLSHPYWQKTHVH